MAKAQRSEKAKTPVTKVSDARVRKGKIKPSDLKDLKKIGHIASELDVVRKRLGVGRASLGSLSESVTVFDPEPLAAIAAELGDPLPDRTPEKFKNPLYRLAAHVARILAPAHRPHTRFIGQNLTKSNHSHPRAEHNWQEASGLASNGTRTIQPLPSGIAR